MITHTNKEIKSLFISNDRQDPMWEEVNKTTHTKDQYL